METKDERYQNSGLAQYEEDDENYDNSYNEFKNEFTYWLESAIDFVAELEEKLSKLPVKEVPDQTDERYRWYTNLWYRMGGQDESHKSNVKNYKELDPNLLNSAEWLEFALEHGIVTMEHATFNENGSVEYPKMGLYDWLPIIYTNASDIIAQDDEIAIARAEAKYKKRMDEIETQDKKYDQDLKKLDTEHNALQTEYESIKGVIEKNVERSFKAFS